MESHGAYNGDVEGAGDRRGHVGATQWDGVGILGEAVHHHENHRLSTHHRQTFVKSMEISAHTRKGSRLKG